MSFFTLKLSEEAKKIKIFPKFQRQMEKTNIFKCKPPEVHFTVRNRVPYNKLLTTRSFSYGPRCAWSVLLQSRANIPQYGPRARLVRGYYLALKLRTHLLSLLFRFFFFVLTRRMAFTFINFHRDLPESKIR